MTKHPRIMKMIGYPFGAALGSSLGVLLIALCVFGFRFTEQEGILVGVVSTSPCDSARASFQVNFCDNVRSAWFGAEFKACFFGDVLHRGVIE